MLYVYKDEFVIGSIKSDVLETQEATAIAEVALLNVVDAPMQEKLVIYSVYMELALMQLENEGMQDKYDSYSKEYTRYLTLAKTGTVSDISNIPIGRG